MAVKTSKSPKKDTAKRDYNTDKKICFVISPIGKKGTELNAKFKEVYEYVIKSAVKASGYTLDVIRADEIDRAGSFIKDILDNLFSSYMVIADLTGQNVNVFYELGVRHSLSPRTILIAQSIDDIPSDLREYRCIVYDTSAKGAAEFSSRLRKYMEEIEKEPERPDNPVLDKIGNIIRNRVELLEIEKQELKNELSEVLKKGITKPKLASSINVSRSVERITTLMNAERQILSGSISKNKVNYSLPGSQGSFKLYFIMGEGTSILKIWYLAEHISDFSYEEDLADIRVLMDVCIRAGQTSCKFIIATDKDLSAEKTVIETKLKKIKGKLKPDLRYLFSLEIWDFSGLINEEKRLGLRVD